MRLTVPTFRRAALLLALAAALHGVLYIPLVSKNEGTDTWTYVASANAILDGTYSTPLRAGFIFVYPLGFFDITGTQFPEETWDAPERQVFRPPGYPAYLALFGKSKLIDGDHTAALLGHGVLFGLGALLLMFAARRWWGENVALVAGLLYAVDPWSKHYVPLALSETLAGLVALAGLYLLTRAWQESRPGWWAATGVAVGALALVRAVFVFAAPLLVVAALLRAGDVRARLLRAGTAAVGSAILLIPWLAWTNSVVDRPAMSAWGQGFNLILAASGEGPDRSSAELETDPEFSARMERVRELAPSREALLADPTAHPRYLDRADRYLRDEAIDLYGERLRKEPHRVAWEVVYRMWFLWNAHKDWYQPSGLALIPLRALDWLLVVLGLAGAGIALTRGGAGRAVVLLLVAYTVVIGTHHVEARFATPLRGVFLALVALSLVTLWRQRRG